MNIEERLREKKIQGYDVYDVKELDFDAELQDLIRLSDALEITKDLFTKEQVNELLKKQREICNREAKVRYTYKKVGLNKQCKIFRSNNSEEYYVDEATILNAPSPSLEGEKK